MIARVAALAAVLVAAIAVAVVLTGGSDTHRYQLLFQSAGQLVKDNDVQVGGRRIGSVRDIELTSDNQARITIEVEEPYAPLHAGTTAVIRATSLSGVANRYVALQPGPQSNERLDDGATLQQDDTTTIVDLDEIFNTLDRPARADLRRVVRAFSEQYRGRAEQAAMAAEYFNPALSTSRRLVQQLTADEDALTDFLVNSSRTLGTVAERRDDLSALIASTNATAGAVAAESASFDEALTILPQTLRRANTTFVNLRATLDDLDRLVDVSKPASRRLAPFLRALRPLVADARPTIADLRRLVGRPGDGNDLVEATQRLPRMQRAASPALVSSRRALQRSQPVLEFIRPYTPELVGWFRDFGQGAANYDANGHFARVFPIANAFSFTDNPAGGTLEAIPPSARLDALQQGIMRRCPGSATQPRPDGSNPYVPESLEGRCDPDEVPPGP